MVAVHVAEILLEGMDILKVFAPLVPQSEATLATIPAAFTSVDCISSDPAISASFSVPLSHTSTALV